VRKPTFPRSTQTGTAEYGEKGDFFFQDDEANPLALRWRIRTSSISASDRTQLQVVKIAYRCNAATRETSALERALAEHGHVDVYDIYFSFHSDEIRHESGADPPRTRRSVAATCGVETEHRRPH
jgi:hypothetical protein